MASNLSHTPLGGRKNDLRALMRERDAVGAEMARKDDQRTRFDALRARRAKLLASGMFQAGEFPTFGPSSSAADLEAADRMLIGLEARASAPVKTAAKAAPAAAAPVTGAPMNREQETDAWMAAFGMAESASQAGDAARAAVKEADPVKRAALTSQYRAAEARTQQQAQAANATVTPLPAAPVADPMAGLPPGTQRTPAGYQSPIINPDGTPALDFRGQPRSASFVPPASVSEAVRFGPGFARMAPADKGKLYRGVMPLSPGSAGEVIGQDSYGPGGDLRVATVEGAPQGLVGGYDPRADQRRNRAAIPRSNFAALGISPKVDRALAVDPQYLRPGDNSIATGTINGQQTAAAPPKVPGASPTITAANQMASIAGPGAAAAATAGLRAMASPTPAQQTDPASATGQAYQTAPRPAVPSPSTSAVAPGQVLTPPTPALNVGPAAAIPPIRLGDGGAGLGRAARKLGSWYQENVAY